MMTATPASAALDYGTSGVCPATQVGATQHSPAGGGGYGSATDCNLTITFASDGSIATAAGPQTSCESIEDALIGVVNNTNHVITWFNLSNPGVDIFGFDADGIDHNAFDDSPSLTVVPSGVHEPAAYALLGMGLAGSAFGRRRRAK